MYRLIVLLLAVAVLGACGKGGEESKQSEPPGQVQTQMPPGHQAIPEEGLSEFEKLAAATLKPYFDEAGTQTTKTIKPGEYVDVYVVAEFNTAYPMSAAEYRLELPPGMTIMGVSKSDSVVIDFGKPEEDVMMAFRCSAGPKLWLMKYFCKTSEDFAGGDISTHEGSNLNYLGFTLCDVTRTKIRATGGKATIGTE